MIHNVKAYGQLRGIRRIWSVMFDNYAEIYDGFATFVRSRTVIRNHYKASLKNNHKINSLRRKSII